MKISKTILLLSPYHGGSHQAWADGFQLNSQHLLELLTMPDRFWKWRMHGGAVTLARRFLASKKHYDLILATDMLDLTTFLALTRPYTATTPTVLYMHENQMTYPLPIDGTTGPMRRQLGERDRHYAFINFASLLAADTVCFNSQFHLDSYFDELPRYLNHLPEFKELGRIAVLREKSRVLPVGVDFKRLDQTDGQASIHNEIPLIIWNQRWEYDKNPAAFFVALFVMADEGIPFRLALCGQQYGKRPSTFDTALNKLQEQIIHVGYADAATYRQLLWEATVTVSTAQHEFFGISILEAIYAHTFPLLPNRLSYPELIPTEWHSDCLYHSQDDLVERLRSVLMQPRKARAVVRGLATAVSKYDWSQIAPQYDDFFAECM